MAYREVAMWEILEVLRRVGRGENKSEVDRRRITVRRADAFESRRHEADSSKSTFVGAALGLLAGTAIGLAQPGDNLKIAAEPEGSTSSGPTGPGVASSTMGQVKTPLCSEKSEALRRRGCPRGHRWADSDARSSTSSGSDWSNT